MLIGAEMAPSHKSAFPVATNDPAKLYIGTPESTKGLVPVLSRASIVAVEAIAVQVVPKAISSVTEFAALVTKML